MGKWIEHESRGLIQEYRAHDLISEAQQAELMTLVVEENAGVAINLLLAIP